MHLIDRKGNDTCSLLSIHDMRILRMVVDYEDDKVMFKDNPNVWHELPTTNKGLMLIPLTKDACERRAITPPLAATDRQQKPKKEEVRQSICHRNAMPLRLRKGGWFVIICLAVLLKDWQGAV